MKTAKKTLIIPALTALAFAGVGAGVTFALFTSESQATINATAGKIQVSGAVTNFKTYSAEANASGDRIDENGAKYNSVLTAVQGTFTNGGTASAVDGVITLDKITPGDRITFDYDIGQTSNVDFLYRVSLRTTDVSDTLVKGLSTKITTGNETQLYKGLKTYISPWIKKSPNEDIDDLSFDIELPIDKGNAYQEKEAHFLLSVEAVQANAAVQNEHTVLTIEEDFASATTVEDGQDTVLEATNNENTVTVKTTIPTGTSVVKTAGNDEIVDGDAAELVVSDVGMSVNPTDLTATFDFDVTLLVNDEPVSEVDTPIPVEIHIGEGYVITAVTHRNVPVTDYTYENGVVRFTTTSFSPFSVEYILDDTSEVARDHYFAIEDYDALASWYEQNDTEKGFIVIANPNTPEASYSAGVFSAPASLYAAINATPAGAPLYISILKNLENPLMSFVGRDVTLDIRDHQITTSIAQRWMSSPNAWGIVYTDPNSSLTLKGTGSVSSSSTNSAAGFLLNAGEVTVEEGVTISAAAASGYSTSMSALVNFGHAYVKGVLRNTAKGSAIMNRASSTTEIVGENAVVSSASYNAIECSGTNITTIVRAGLVQGGISGSSAPVHAIMQNQSSQSTIVNGGAVYAGDADNSLFGSSGTITLNGGVFNKEIVPDGSHIVLGQFKSVVNNGDGTWSIEEIPLLFNIVHSDTSVTEIHGENNDAALADGFAQVVSGDTIELGSAVYGIRSSHVASLPEGVTIKGNGGSTMNMRDNDVIFNHGVTIQNVHIRGGFAVTGAENESFLIKDCDFAKNDVEADGHFWDGWYYALCVADGNAADVTVDGCTASGYGARTFEIHPASTPEADYSFLMKNCNVEGLYPVHNDCASDITITIEDTTLAGWCSFDSCHELLLTRVTFAAHNNAVFQPYGKAILTECEFDECFLDACFGIGSDSVDADLINCTVNGEPLTADHVKSMVDAGDRAAHPGAVWKVNGTPVVFD